MSEQQYLEMVEIIFTLDFSLYAILMGFVCGLVLSFTRWLADRGSAAAYIHSLEDENFGLKNQIRFMVEQKRFADEVSHASLLSESYPGKASIG